MSEVKEEQSLKESVEAHLRMICSNSLITAQLMQSDLVRDLSLMLLTKNYKRYWKIIHTSIGI